MVLTQEKTFTFFKSLLRAARQSSSFTLCINGLHKDFLDSFRVSWHEFYGDETVIKEVS